MGQPGKINSEQYLTGGRAFGPFVSRNLTPDHTGKPAGLTFDEFRTTLRTGQDPEGPRGQSEVEAPGERLPRLLEHGAIVTSASNVHGDIFRERGRAQFYLPRTLAPHLATICL